MFVGICEEKIAFSVQLVETMCQDFPQLVTGNMLINFQEKTRRVALSCSTPAPVQTNTNTPTPVKTTVTPVTTKAPVVPQTGPETFLTLTLALGAAGILTARRRRRQDRA